LDDAFVDRLTLTPKTIAAMADGLAEIAALPDPVGEITDLRYRPTGIQVGRMRVPLGVVGIIYESRPNVTADAAGLCLKAGNATILRGGSEALRSNAAIAECVHHGLREAGLPEAAVQVVATTDRAAVGYLIADEKHVDVIVPRGGKGLIERIAREARVPVIKHLDGVCHVFVDASADVDMAVRIADNAKTQRYSPCNTMETLLVHSDIAARVLPPLCDIYLRKGVELRGDDRARDVVPAMKAATEDDWYAEYLRRSSPFASSTRSTMPSRTSRDTVRSTRTPSSRRTTRMRCASCAKSTQARCSSTPPRDSPTGSSSAWAPRSASRPTSCMRAGPSGSKASPARSSSCWDRARSAPRRAPAYRASAHTRAPRRHHGEQRQRAVVHHLPSGGRHERARRERRHRHRREHDRVVGALRARLFGGPVRLGEQRRAARVHEVPSDADQRERGQEVRVCVAVQRDDGAERHDATLPTITLSTPKRPISDPVTKPGAYMPTTCHEITIAACAYASRRNPSRAASRSSAGS
jgi:hypothetical protein